MIKYAIPKKRQELIISVEDFIEKFNNNEAVLVDVRMPFEKKIWNVPFAIDMDPVTMEEKYEELPKNKLIVTACPGTGRSPFTAIFLKEKGFNVKHLDGGLAQLIERLKGGKAKDLKID